MKVSGIIPAAGSGSRYSRTKNKLLENLQGVPVIVHTLRVISSIDIIDDITICTSEDLIDKINSLIETYQIPKIKNIILGGATRQESVFIGLKSLKNSDYVLIHDGARPLISEDIIDNALKCTFEKGSAVVAVPAKDTIKRVNPETNQIIETLNRHELWNIQTPQIFRYKEILDAHIKYAGQNFTDDSALMEESGKTVYIAMGSYKNIKITTAEDIAISEILNKKAPY